MTDDPNSVKPFDGADVVNALAHDTPEVIIIAQFPDGSSACYWSGYHGATTNPETMVKAIRSRDRQAVVKIYQRNDSPRYQMPGPTGEQFGEGWYVIADLAMGPIPWETPFYGFGPSGPPKNPRLVRAERIHWHDHHRLEVTGTDCDTGEHIDLCQVYYVLGPREEDAAPFRTDIAARFTPARVHATRQW